MFGTRDVAVRGLYEFMNDVFDVFTDVTGFGQRRRIRNRKRHVQDAGKRLREQRLPGPRRPHEQHVRLRQFHPVIIREMPQTLVVVVNRHGQHTLGAFLTDHVVIEVIKQFLRRRQFFREFGGGCRCVVCLRLFAGSRLGRSRRRKARRLHEALDAAVADLDAAARIDQRLAVVLDTAAHRAAFLFLIVCKHSFYLRLRGA